jgi:integrase
MARTFTKLTRPAMRSLPKGASIIEHGITFTREANGDGLFTVNVMVDRQRIHRTIGRESDGTTRTTCEDFIAKARQDARNGRLNLPKRRKVALTLAAAAPKYIDRLKAEGGKDIARKKQRLNDHLVPFFGASPLTKITTFDVERYKKHRLALPNRPDLGADKANAAAQTNRPATVNRELATLSHLLNKAYEWNWIERPSIRIQKLREDNSRITYLAPAEAEKLLEAAASDENPQIHAFILIGLRTGMRKSEILAIRKQDVDLTNRTIHVPKAKAGGRTQPLTDDLGVFLSSYIAGLPSSTNWLFPSETSRTGHTIDVRKAFIRSVERAGLNPKEVVRHTLRHTAITHLVQAGVDLPTVKRISGHKTMSMVERYAHQSGAHIAEAMAKLEARYRKQS